MIIKPCCKLPVGTVRNLLQIPVHVGLIESRVFQIIINCFPVCAGDCSHIESAFHPPFYLIAVNSRFHKIRNMVNHTEVFGVKDEGSSFIFQNRKIFSRTGFFLQKSHLFFRTCFLFQLFQPFRILLRRCQILPSAGMRAGTPIGISACKIIGKKTSSGVGYAHCPVDKTFYFQILRNLLPDLPDFLQRQLPGRNHPACSQAVPEKEGLRIGIICLCADMAVYFRTDFSRESEYSGVCNNEGVRMEFLQFFQIDAYSFQISVMCQNIDCHMHLDPVFMCVADPLRHIVTTEIFCLCPESEHFSADIDRICPKGDRHLQHLQAGGRNQKLRFSFSVHHPHGNILCFPSSTVSRTYTRKA